MVTSYIGAKISDFGTSRSLDRHFSIDGTSFVGTPLFAAPEVARMEQYSEKIDVYSYGLILLELAVSGGLFAFFQKRWQSEHPSAPGCFDFRTVLNEVWHRGWRPVDHETTGKELFSAPPSISELILRCCAHEPAQRPSFREILEILTTQCLAEVERDSIEEPYSRVGEEIRQSLHHPHAFLPGMSDAAHSNSFSSTSTTDAVVSPVRHHSTFPCTTVSHDRDLQEPLL